MAEINFPNNPNDGDLFVAQNGVTYKFILAQRKWIVYVGTGVVSSVNVLGVISSGITSVGGPITSSGNIEIGLNVAGLAARNPVLSDDVLLLSNAGGTSNFKITTTTLKGFIGGVIMSPTDPVLTTTIIDGQLWYNTSLGNVAGAGDMKIRVSNQWKYPITLDTSIFALKSDVYTKNEVYNKQEADARFLRSDTSIGGFKNKIINGGMSIFQRAVNTTDDFSNTYSRLSTSGYALDRWFISANNLVDDIIIYQKRMSPNETFMGPTQNYMSINSSVGPLSKFGTNSFLATRLENFELYQNRDVSLSFLATKSGSSTNLPRIDLIQTWYSNNAFQTVTTNVVLNLDLTPTVTATSAIGWNYKPYVVRLPALPAAPHSGGSWNNIDYDKSWFEIRFTFEDNFRGVFNIAQVQLEFSSQPTGFEVRDQTVEFDMCRRFSNILKPIAKIPRLIDRDYLSKFNTEWRWNEGDSLKYMAIWSYVYNIIPDLRVNPIIKCNVMRSTAPFGYLQEDGITLSKTNRVVSIKGGATNLSNQTSMINALSWSLLDITNDAEYYNTLLVKETGGDILSNNSASLWNVTLGNRVLQITIISPYENATYTAAYNMKRQFDLSNFYGVLTKRSLTNEVIWERVILLGKSPSIVVVSPQHFSPHVTVLSNGELVVTWTTVISETGLYSGPWNCECIVIRFSKDGNLVYKKTNTRKNIQVSNYYSAPVAWIGDVSIYDSVNNMIWRYHGRYFNTIGYIDVNTGIEKVIALDIDSKGSPFILTNPRFILTNSNQVILIAAFNADANYGQSDKLCILKLTRANIDAGTITSKNGFVGPPVNYPDTIRLVKLTGVVYDNKYIYAYYDAVNAQFPTAWTSRTVIFDIVTLAPVIIKTPLINNGFVAGYSNMDMIYGTITDGLMCTIYAKSYDSISPSYSIIYGMTVYNMNGTGPVNTLTLTSDSIYDAEAPKTVLFSKYNDQIYNLAKEIFAITIKNTSLICSSAQSPNVGMKFSDFNYSSTTLLNTMINSINMTSTAVNFITKVAPVTTADYSENISNSSGDTYTVTRSVV